MTELYTEKPGIVSVRCQLAPGERRAFLKELPGDRRGRAVPHRHRTLRTAFGLRLLTCCHVTYPARRSDIRGRQTAPLALVRRRPSPSGEQYRRPKVRECRLFPSSSHHEGTRPPPCRFRQNLPRHNPQSSSQTPEPHCRRSYGRCHAQRSMAQCTGAGAAPLPSALCHSATLPHRESHRQGRKD